MPKRGENIHKRKDGRWEGRYKKNISQNEKTRYGSVYGKTYGEVKSKLKELNQKPLIENNYSVNEKSFREVLQLWENVNHVKHKGATKTKYSYMIEKHIIPKLGNIPISSINSLILNDFVENKLKSGRLDGKGGLSSAYVRSMMIIISSALQYAANEGMCPPLKSTVFKPPIENKVHTILEKQEQERLEMFLTTDINETKVGILLSLNCGLRIGEVCALKWEDIDLENKVIHIKSTIARVKKDETANGTILIIDTPKTKSSLRDVPLHSQMMAILRKEKDKAIYPFVVSNSDSFVSPRTYEYRFHRILEQCGINSVNYHALRHTFATRCILAGMDVKSLSEILGHSNVSITLNTYVHPSMEMKLQQIEKLAILTA